MFHCFVGLVTYTGVLLLSLTWVFHTLHLFGSTAFPFKLRKLWQSKSFKWKAHVAELVVILIYGLTPSIIIIFVDEFKFPGFPLLCISNYYPLTNFYIFSNTLTSITSVSLLFITFWIIHKVCICM